jgi:hypothetical protein
LKRTQSSQQMFGLAAAELEFVSQLDFDFSGGDVGADDEDVPVTAPSEEEEALDFFTEEIDKELDGGLGIDPFGSPAAAAPSTVLPELSARTKPNALAQRRCCGSGPDARCAAPPPKRQVLHAIENSQSQGVAAPRAAPRVRAAQLTGATKGATPPAPAVLFAGTGCACHGQYVCGAHSRLAAVSQDSNQKLIARDFPIVRTEKARGPRARGQPRPASIEAATTAREYLEAGGEIWNLRYDLKEGFFRVGEAAEDAVPTTQPPPPAAEEAPPPPDEPAIKPSSSFAFTNVSTGEQVQGEPDDDLPTSSARKRKQALDLEDIMGGSALARVRHAIEGLRGAAYKLQARALATLRRRKNTSKEGLPEKSLRDRMTAAMGRAPKQATHSLFYQARRGRDDDDFDDLVTDLAGSLQAKRKDEALVADFHAGLKALPTIDETAEETTCAKGLVVKANGDVMLVDACSKEKGVDRDRLRVILSACASILGRLVQNFPEQSTEDAVMSAIGQTHPRECAIAKLLTRETYDIVERYVERAKARCENNYHLAWAAFAGAADHAAHHGEQLVLYRALSALGGRSAKIAIVAFGHPACTDCFCLFKLLGDVVPKTSTVPAALCPRGLNYRNVGVDCCVYILDW